MATAAAMIRNEAVAGQTASGRDSAERASGTCTATNCRLSHTRREWREGRGKGTEKETWRERDTERVHEERREM